MEILEDSLALTLHRLVDARFGTQKKDLNNFTIIVGIRPEDIFTVLNNLKPRFFCIDKHFWGNLNDFFLAIFRWF